MPASAVRTLVVLSTLAESQEPLTVSRLSEASGIARASLGRLLASLEAEGSVRMDESGRYSVTLRVLHPGLALLSTRRIRDVAFPELVQLSRSIGYEVHLGLYEFPEILFIESVYALDSNVSSRLNYATKPLLLSHTGRLLVSFQSTGIQEELWRERSSVLPETADERALRDEIRRCRADRYIAFDRTEDDSPAGLAVPIFDASEQAVASITITRAKELDSQFLASVLPRVQDAARRISAALGSRQVGVVSHL